MILNLSQDLKNFDKLSFFILLVLLSSCSSSQHVTSQTLVESFDERQYVNPQDFGYPLSFKEIEESTPADSLFTPVLVQGGMQAAFGKIRYPVEAQTNDVQGEVVLRLYVNKAGKLAKIVVLESPHELLTQATLKAACKWQYNAATLSGTPVNSFIHVPINFRTQTQKIGIEG